MAEHCEREEVEALWQKEDAGVVKWRRSGKKKLLELWNGGALAKRSCWSEERSSWSKEESMERRNVSSAVSSVEKSSKNF